MHNRSDRDSVRPFGAGVAAERQSGSDTGMWASRHRPDSNNNNNNNNNNNSDRERESARGSRSGQPQEAGSDWGADNGNSSGGGGGVSVPCVWIPSADR